MVDFEENNGADQGHKDNEKHAQLYDRLKNRVGQRRAARGQTGRRARDQCQSPLRKSLSSTPVTEKSDSDDDKRRELKTSLDVLKEHSPTTDFFKLALRKLLCYSLVERMSCPTSEPAISWLADISHNLRAIGASDSQVDLVSQHLRDHAIPTLSALLADVLVDESQLDVVINTLRDRMREAQNSRTVAQRHSPSRRDSAMSNVDIEDATGPAFKRRKVQETTASSDSPSSPAREFDFEGFRTLDLAQRRMFATKTFSAPIEL